MDRWNIITSLNYLEPNEEIDIVLSKLNKLKNKKGRDIIESMVAIAGLTRTGFINGDISTVMSPRTVITWAENYLLFNDIKYSFDITFLSRCDELEHSVINEYYQRCFGEEISDQIQNK